MARFDDDDELDTSGLRDYLLAEAVKFREILAHPVRPSHHGHPVLDADGEPRRYPLNVHLWGLLSGAVEQLGIGAAYRFERWELPAEHFALGVGGQHDTLELGRDEVLRLVVDSPANAGAKDPAQLRPLKTQNWLTTRTAPDAFVGGRRHAGGGAQNVGSPRM